MKSKEMTLLLIIICLAILVATTSIYSIQENQDFLFTKYYTTEEQIEKLQKQLDTLQDQIKELTGTKLPGEWTATAYCSCSACCGHSTGITSTGKHVKEGMVACSSK